jgi:hypothetical protein
MLIRPELQALRSDDTPQRHAQSDLHLLAADWRASRLGTGLEEGIAAYARGELLEHLPQLARLFTPGDPAALRLTRDLIDRFAAVLAAKPWGQVPLRHKVDDMTATLVLAGAGNAALVLQAIDGAGLRRRPPALTASFSPGDTHDHVLAGSARARTIELRGETEQGADLVVNDCELGEGQVMCRNGARQTLLIDAAPTTLVTLKLQRRPASGSVTREFRLADGTLAHQATGNPRESRFELAAALLGRMGRSDAAPLLAAMAEEQGGQSLRWQSLKECLGLDTGEGFAALCRIAARIADPLSIPAEALRMQLLETYPRLAGVSSCPA